jgi:class 3 adenylate cyclase
MNCPRCQTQNPENARFCLNCGLALARHCSNCQTELLPGARFCMACGQPVLEQTPVDADRFTKLTASAPGELRKKIRKSSQKNAIPGPGTLGEKRNVTALIVDVVGSTKLADKLDLETWTRVMNSAFDELAKVIYKYEGTIVRLLGDSLLAFFGAPVAHEDDPQRAVRAGLEMIDLIKEYSVKVKEENGVDFTVRVCLNTGPVVIGPVGDDMRFEYTAFGGTVNLASRIKFAGTAMNILVTNNTYRFIAPYFECQDLGTLEVKGMEGELRVYQVISSRAILGRTRGFADLESPMVGRDQELATLLGLCEAIKLGLGRAALITGEIGIGKTRLIQEWQRVIEAGGVDTKTANNNGKIPYRRWVKGRCNSYGQGIAYQLLIDVLLNLLGVGVGSDEPEIHETLFKLTQDLFADRVMEVYPYLGHLLSLKLEGEALERTKVLDPQAMQTQYLLAMQHLFKKITQASPLILILEDLHWADASSIEVLIKLLPMVSREPTLFCMVTRPETASNGWKLVNAARELLGGSLTEITLQALSEKDSRSLVANLLEIETLPDRIRRLILKKAEGNPFYVEELIRMLIERGAIQHENGTWVAQQVISDRDIPDNLQGLLLGRIDRLPAEARYTLLVASVIGRNFPVKVLSQVMGGNSDEPVE